ncbi:polysaccharide lyase family protein [Ereboglobus luteus]|uniref:polysaccharide lyase family protein n=1 Tax=Ereboglobus luteus TaxID=1796921 RepID=UPI00137532E0
MLGEFRRDDIAVNPGATTALGDLIWTPVRHGRQLWEIGTPDRTAREFRHGDNHRRWGLWLEYPKDFPNDITYIIGKSDPPSRLELCANRAHPARRHVSRRHMANLFDCDNPYRPAAATPCCTSRLPGRTQHPARPRQRARGRHRARFAERHAMMRAGIHGQYTAARRAIPRGLAARRAKRNRPRTPSANAVAKNIMYDYLRLEVPQ